MLINSQQFMSRITSLHHDYSQGGGSGGFRDTRFPRWEKEILSANPYLSRLRPTLAYDPLLLMSAGDQRATGAFQRVSRIQQALSTYYTRLR
ncbi:hypothetical protein BDZ94DRAFT_1262632 [Collybia nuda]|uniref:Uncharacterized protein n=1 Tax=Collybia nuda TaxID=64659 RepID=A0A9P5Y486_9AGAR|nr:hypothetical protein BDZ94DRAFT_1262632 [Collybia nuda]